MLGPPLASGAMVRVHTTRQLDQEQHGRVLAFLDAAHTLDCARLDDHLRVDLAQGPREGFVAALAEDDAGTLVGYGQASVGNAGYVIDAIVWSLYEGDADEATGAMLATLLGQLPPEAAVSWWAHPDSHALAGRLGLAPDRRLLMMQRPLPTGIAADVEVRPFRPGVDEQAWLAVNNAAFAEHGEQGGWDLATLRQREAEAWFDPAGFLLHERDGRLAGFCWVKLHHPTPEQHCAPGEQIVGEIYVVAVHPEFHGLGLGRQLTVVGMNHMEAAGAGAAMLYVDVGNTAAVALYRSLGFSTAHEEQSYRRPPRRLT